MMDRELKVGFIKIGSRQDFLKKFKERIIDFVGPENKEFVLMLTEIVKNIYDHNNGRGYAKLREGTDGKIYFELANIVESESTKSAVINYKKDGVNYGFGVTVGGIKTIAQELNINLEFDISAGFLYKGAYKLK